MVTRRCSGRFRAKRTSEGSEMLKSLEWLKPAPQDFRQTLRTLRTMIDAGDTGIGSRLVALADHRLDNDQLSALAPMRQALCRRQDAVNAARPGSPGADRRRNPRPCRRRDRRLGASASGAGRGGARRLWLLGAGRARRTVEPPHGRSRHAAHRARSPHARA